MKARSEEQVRSIHEGEVESQTSALLPEQKKGEDETVFPSPGESPHDDLTCEEHIAPGFPSLT